MNKTMPKWSKHVTDTSNALDLEKGVFTWKNPERIAISIKQSAERSTRRKSSVHQSAMSMLNFYINRAGSQITDEQKAILQKTKQELRKLFNDP